MSSVNDESDKDLIIQQLKQKVENLEEQNDNLKTQLATKSSLEEGNGSADVAQVGSIPTLVSGFLENYGGTSSTPSSGGNYFQGCGQHYPSEASTLPIKKSGSFFSWGSSKKREEERAAAELEKLKRDTELQLEQIRLDGERQIEQVRKQNEEKQKLAQLQAAKREEERRQEMECQKDEMDREAERRQKELDKKDELNRQEFLKQDNEVKKKVEELHEHRRKLKEMEEKEKARIEQEAHERKARLDQLFMMGVNSGPSKEFNEWCSQPD